MFGFLKKRLKEAISKVAKKIEKKEEPKKEEEKPKKERVEKKVRGMKEPKKRTEMEEKVESAIEDRIEELEELKEEVREEAMPEPKIAVEEELREEIEAFEEVKEQEMKKVMKKQEKEVKEKKGIIGLLKLVKEKKLTESDVEKILQELQIALLENDVALEVAEKICDDVKRDLLGKNVKRGKVEFAIKSALRKAMLDVLSQEKLNLEAMISRKKPFTVVFFGFNGTGKCVTGDTLIQLNDGQIIPIKDLYESVSKRYGEQQVEDGHIVEHPELLAIPTVDTDTLKIRKAPITHLWKLKKDKIIEVTISNGHKIKVTPEHPFFVLKDGTIGTLRADSLSVNDYVMVPKTVCMEYRKLTTPEILEIVKNKKLFVNSKPFVQNLYKCLKAEYGTLKKAWETLETGVSEITFAYYWPSKNRVPSTFAIAMYHKYPELRNHIGDIFLSFNNSHNTAKLTELGKDFYKFAGLFYGEGYLNRKYIEFTNTDEMLLREFEKSCSRAFGVTKFSKTSDKRNPRVKSIRVSSATLSYLASVLMGIPNVKKNKNMCIPSFLMATADDNIAEMLKWYWECDGSIEKKHRVLEAVTGSRLFAEQLSMLLLRFGIIASMREKLVNNVPFYRVWINGKQKIKDFYDKIGVATENRREKILRLIVMPAQFEISELIPHQGTAVKHLRTANNLTQVDVSNILGVWNSLICQYESDKYDVSIPIERLQQMSDNIPVKSEFLEKLAHADVRWIKVESTMEIFNSEQYVYDLTVEGTHNFIAGNFIVHNTTNIAKFAYKFKKYNPVFAAGDTFRAASIEQLEEHAKRLGMKVIKHDYKADSAAVIYDARRHAESSGAGLVLADTAGRSHSNVNLMDELKKVVRVNKPDLKILVLDSLAGNDIYDQSRLFNDAVGVDAIILTKADVYEKGGAALSAAYTIKKPILFLGTGQNYEDLKEFEPEEIVDGLLE